MPEPVYCGGEAIFDEVKDSHQDFVEMELVSSTKVRNHSGQLVTENYYRCPRCSRLTVIKE